MRAAACFPDHGSNPLDQLRRRRPHPDTERIPDPIAGTLPAIAGPLISPNPLKTNGSEKRRNDRQKSSKVVRTTLNLLISLKIQ
jgi:hypothetical protein